MSALAALFGGTVGKDTVSRVWRKVKRLGRLEHLPLAEEPIVRLILDGTVVRVRLDRKATSISLLVALGARGRQKVLLAIKSMGGESAEAWAHCPRRPHRCGLRRPGVPHRRRRRGSVGDCRRLGRRAGSAARSTSTGTFSPRARAPA